VYAGENRVHSFTQLQAQLATKAVTVSKHTHFTNVLLVFNSHNLFTQVSVSSPSRPKPWSRLLPDEESKIGRALAGGNLQSLANAVMEHRGLRDLVLLRFLDSIDAECTTLCRRSLPSTFRKISTPTLGEFNWELMVDELQAKAPTLLRVLSTICAHNDHRNQKKCGSMHYPSICMAASVILKERNREMCGLQSMMSLLLFASRVDKVVSVYACVLEVEIAKYCVQGLGVLVYLPGGRPFCTLVTAMCKTTPRGVII